MSENKMNKKPILSQEHMEALYMFPNDSKTNQLVDMLMRSVFAKMVRGLGINAADFEFMAFDNGKNAFFISGDKTQNGKNLISVSLALLRSLGTEEELAAVMAHECGHYIWKHSLGGKNSIFQERGADLYAVDLLINGGYNPVAILNTYKKIFGRVSYTDATLDVHGNDAMRIDDVKAYLTKISNEKGVFPVPETTDAAFCAVVDEIVDLRELTCDFWLRELYNKFGYDVFWNGNRTEILRFFIQQLKIQGPLITDARSKSFVNILTGMYFTSSLTNEDLTICRDIFLFFYNSDNKYAKSVFSAMNLSEQMSKELFGPFKQHAENIQKFVDSAYDEKQAEYYADICLQEYEKIKPYIDEFRFKWPEFKGLGVDNVGKKLPWVQMASYKSGKIREFCRYLVDDGRYSKPNVQMDKYLFDGDIVMAYGDDVKNIVYDVEFEKYEGRIAEKIKMLDALRRLDIGEISVQEYIEITKSMERKKSKEDLIDGFFKFPNPELINKSKRAKEFLSEFYKTPLFNNVIQNNTLVQCLVNNRGCKDFYVADKLAAFTSGCVVKELMFMAARAYAKYSEYINETKAHKNEHGYTECSVNVWYEYNEVFKLLLGASFHPRGILNGKKYDDYLGDIVNKERDLFSDIAKKERQKIAIVASQNDALVNTGNDSWRVLEDAIVHEFEENKKSQILKNIMKRWGVKEPQTEEELLTFFTAYNVKSAVDGRRISLGMGIGVFVFFNYILSGYKFDVKKILPYLRTPYSNVMQNLLAKYMDENKSFEIEPLDSQISMFQTMLKNDLFYGKTANKNKYIKIIVDKLTSVRDVNSDEYQKNVKIVHDILLRKLLVDRNNDLEFVTEREKLIDFYAGYWAKRLGRDNGTHRYVENLQPVVDLIKGNSDNVFSRMVANSFVRKFTDKIVAQQKVAELLEDAKIVPVSGDMAEKYDYYGRGAEKLLSELAKNPKHASSMIKFLSERFTDENYERLLGDGSIKELQLNSVVSMYANKQMFMMLHENFWSAGLELRAVVINRLLNCAYRTKQEKINMLVDMFFENDSEYRQDAELIINALYNNLSDYERDLIISAIVCAGQRDKNNNMTEGQAMGQGLKMFLQNKGPAFIKFGQLLSYMPNLDSDIRKELSHLRDKAAIPSRYDLYQMIDMTLPADVKSKITHVGEVLGAGSFYVTVKIIYDGTECVVGLMRPNVEKLTKTGMAMIQNTINEIVEKDAKYKPLTKVIQQARTSAMSEIDIENDYQKYLKAVDLYENLTVSTQTGDYSPDVARWMSYGQNPDGTAYKIMEMAAGKSLSADEWTPEEKHDFAVAYVTLELCILLSGQQWDTDRHQGQQNFYNHAFRDFVIGVFDTGAQMDEKPNITDKIMLGMMLFDMLDYVKSGRDLSDVLMREENDKFAKKYGATPTYIDGVKRGLTALSDIMEYQKEIKDENGKVIQESKSLTRDDMENIISAVVRSGVVSKTVLSTIGARAIVGGMVADMTKRVLNIRRKRNPITVRYTRRSKDKISERINMGQAELQDVIAERNKIKQFGIDKRYVAKGGTESGTEYAF